MKHGLMPRNRLIAGRNHGFTLIELMVVISIGILLVAITIPSLKGLNGSGSFTRTVTQVQEILEQARAYAIAENTYVWVAFYPVDPSTLTGVSQDNSGDQLYIATIASNIGSDPLNWTNSYVMGSDDTLSQINKVKNFKQVRIQSSVGNFSTDIPAVPSSAPVPTPLADNLLIKTQLQSPRIMLGTQATPNNEPPIMVIQFTPSGSAQVGSSLSASIGIDLLPMAGPGVTSTNNIATLRINGLIGSVTLYRK